MQLTHLTALVVTSLVGPAPADPGAAPPPEPPEDAGVRQTVAAFADAWNAGDTAAFRRLFAPDANFVVITGRTLRGADEIARYHADLWAHPDVRSRLAITSVRVRVVRPGVAVAHVGAVVSFDAGRDARTGAALFMLTAERGPDGGRWAIASVHDPLAGDRAGGAPAAAPAAPADTAETLALEGAWRDARVREDTAFLERFYAAEVRIQDTGGQVVTREQDAALFAGATLVPKS